jgi:hypothetical protein
MGFPRFFRGPSWLSPTLITVKFKDLNHLPLCLLAKTPLRPQASLFYLRLKLLISPKRRGMSICASALADLSCNVTIFVACVAVVVIV